MSLALALQEGASSGAAGRLAPICGCVSGLDSRWAKTDVSEGEDAHTFGDHRHEPKLPCPR